MLTSRLPTTNYSTQQKAVEQSLFSRIRPSSAKPEGWTKPRFNTPEYWGAVGNDWITDSEATADQAAHDARVKRGKASLGTVGAYPARWHRPTPQETRQYSAPMSTEAARDDRLTPQAKALLQVIRARCGKGRDTQTTKFTLGDIMRRSERTIQRYIRELVRFGYIDTTTRTNRRGLYTGLIITIMDKVLPFWEDAKELAADLAEKFAHQWSEPRRNQEETLLTPKNQTINISSKGTYGHAFGMT